MSGRRADLGFGAALDDLGSFAAPAPARRPRAAEEDTRRAAEAAGFRSREPLAAGNGAGELEPTPEPAPAPAAPLRRRRTGRNAQFNIKARPETIEAFCRIADAQGWGLGETLEKAVALLERDFPAR